MRDVAGYYALLFLLIGVVLLAGVLGLAGVPPLSLENVILYVAVGFVGVYILRRR